MSFYKSLKMNYSMKETHFFWHFSKIALGQSFLFGVFLITITSFFHLHAPKYLESKKIPNKSSNSQCSILKARDMM